MIRSALVGVTASIVLLAASCTQEEPGSGNQGSGGSGGSGGAKSSGGSSGSGGAGGNGGTASSGGTTASGGTISSGGTTGSGGATGSGGNTSSGGEPGTGGATRRGGATGDGGTQAATGGAAGGRTGGSPRTGGSTGTGGATSTGTGGSTSNGGSTGGGCPSVDFGTWASGKDPTTVGKAGTDYFIKNQLQSGLTNYGGDGYAWTFGYVGSLMFTQTIKDTTNNSSMIGKFDCNMTGPDNGNSASVDTRAFGDLPLEIYLEAQKDACKNLGLLRADAQWSRTTSDGITSDARYWIDDMYMITSLQVWAYRATKDQKYLDRAAKTMVAYIGQLQKDNDTKTTGLFWHTKQSKAYWGRANGWVASGMTELLLELPTSNTNYNAIMAAYKKQMDALVQHQIASGTDVGGWRQVIDRSDAKPEMSCSAMFTFALSTGVKNGWLTDQKYVTAAANGWKAIAGRTNSSGLLSQVCPGTGQANAGDLASQQQFYMNISFPANDRHGQGPLLWAANALLREDCPGVR